MEDLVEVIVFIVMILLALWGFISNEFGNVALEKGHDKIKYSLIVFFFSLAGILLVISLPDRKSKNTTIQALGGNEQSDIHIEATEDEIPEL